jgi:hypothetical protein
MASVMLEGHGMNKINSGFTRLTDKELDNRAAQIITALTGNTSFPTPAPTLAVIQTKLTAYQAALAMPEGVARTQAVKATRDDLSTALEQLARNLELTPNVTDTQLATTGFDLRKPAAQTADVPPAPANLRLKPTGVSGEVQFQFDPSARAKTYELQTSLDPNSGNWTQNGMFSSSRGVVVGGFTRGKDVWGRVRAVGPNNTVSGWSDPATVMVA